MSKKSAKIEELLRSCRGQANLPLQYIGYFECFNRGLFFEAHDVLEELWLANKQGPNHSFYKGLIQFAGAFVHLQKNRLRPSAALFKLARANVEKYPNIHEQLDVRQLVELISEWLQRLEVSDFAVNPLLHCAPPKLTLLPAESQAQRESAERK